MRRLCWGQGSGSLALLCQELQVPLRTAEPQDLTLAQPLTSALNDDCGSRTLAGMRREATAGTAGGHVPECIFLSKFRTGPAQGEALWVPNTAADAAW